MNNIMFGEKRKETFQSFLSGVPAKDYIFQQMDYQDQIIEAAKEIENAEYILIGAGAGLSTAAGLTMGGERWDNNFGEFEKKYNSPYMRDMYSAGFYPFPSEEAKWGYWSKAGMLNRVTIGSLPLYKRVLEMVKAKKYFVLTTNVDHQFHLAGFDETKIFATQGDYGLIQCRKGCHAKTYDATKLFAQMDQARKDCCIPSYMVPKCPVCGGPMEMNLRADQYFVEDEDWEEAEKRFGEFLSECAEKKTVLLELGCGFNTPTIIRFPFENLMREHENLTMIRMNLDEAVVPENLGNRILGINADMVQSIEDLTSALEENAPKNKKTDEQEQERRLDYLVDKFKEDSGQYRDLEVPDAYEEKRKILRSLMNIRMPRSMEESVIKVQDEFLSEEAKEKGIVMLEDIPTIREQYQSRHPYADQISIWQGDITRLAVGAIVNAANSQMLGCFVPCHRCIDNAIHSAAGIELREACSHQMNQRRIKFGQRYEEPTGQAMLTDGYNLPAEHVIHTVGPIVGSELNDSLRQDLKNCYRNVMQCCVENQIRSVAFCCISTGEFHFPNDEAARIAVETVSAFLKEYNQRFDRIIFNVFKDEDKDYYENELIR